MEALGFSKNARRTFHDIPYVLTVAGDNESLSIEVEHAEDGRRWRSQFAARFIEEITQRTGNAKKFDVFVRMLLSALAQESDSVYMDVLTARDLEMLRRHANPQGPPTTSTAGHSDKRYLILTYRAEFDKVHYPLPLPLDERSEEETLRAVAGRLRAELADAHRTIAELEQAASSSAAPPTRVDDERAAALQRQNTELSDFLRVAQRELDQLRSELRLKPVPASEVELNKLRAERTRLQGEIKSLKEEMRQRETQHKRNADKFDRDLRSERLKGQRLEAQSRRLEEEKKAMGNRLYTASRSQSNERSRPTSRTPSAERARPPSRPTSRPPSRTPSRIPSRPVSRASSVASSHERSSSPGNFPGSGGPASRSGDPRPWAFQRSGSPGGDRPGARRQERQAPSPTATLSPYRRAAGTIPPARRTPSPGTRSRERTPSPGQARGGAPTVGAPMSLRGGVSPTPPPAAAAAFGASGGGLAARPPASSRYAGSRPGSASRTSGLGGSRGAGSIDQNGRYAEGPRAGSRGPPGSSGAHAVPDDPAPRPGSLFGLAANLGLGPGSLSAANPGVSTSSAHTSAAPADDAEACDIDARLQALQSFLKQTKNISS